MEIFAVLKMLIIIGLCIIAGILAGNSAVVVFNRIPAYWLCDYDEEPCEELKRNDTQRIKSVPWKMTFSMIFMLAALKMAVIDWKYALAALFSMWALLLIAIADKKYMIIPDQFVILLALTAFGYVPYHSGYMTPIFGALLGGGCMLFIGVTGKLVFKKDALGFGDVKLFAALGLITGPYGILIILAASSFLSCIGFGIGLVRKKIKKTDVQALGPYIALSAFLYLLF